MHIAGTLGRFRVLAAFAISLAGCNAVQDLVSVTPDELLTLNVSTSQVAADGVSTVTLTARLSNALGEGSRTVTFEADDGIILGRTCDSFGVCTNKIAVVATADGTATAQLQAGRKLGQATVRAVVGEVATSATVEFVRAYPDHISIELDRGALQACFGDFATLEIRLTRDRGSVTVGTVVELSATIGGIPFGSFPGTVTADADGVATATFSPGTAPILGVGLIRARVRNLATGAVIEGTATVDVIPIDPFSSVCG